MRSWTRVHLMSAQDSVAFLSELAGQVSLHPQGLKLGHRVQLFVQARQQSHPVTLHVRRGMNPVQVLLESLFGSLARLTDIHALLARIATGIEALSLRKLGDRRPELYDVDAVVLRRRWVGDRPAFLPELTNESILATDSSLPAAVALLDPKVEFNPKLRSKLESILPDSLASARSEVASGKTLAQSARAANDIDAGCVSDTIGISLAYVRPRCDDRVQIHGVNIVLGSAASSSFPWPGSPYRLMLRLTRNSLDPHDSYPNGMSS